MTLVKELINSIKANQKIIKPSKPLVWIDCEMTGLNITKDYIIEICCIITDGKLNIIDEKGYESTVYYDDSVLSTMNDWCQEHHRKSGLYDKVLNNPQRSLSIVQDELLEYIKKYVDPNKGILSGNSVHMDKFFMQKDFPKVIDYLHYRLVDVSSIMEVGNRHNPKLMQFQPKKIKDHTAKSDILESIGQLKWFQENYLKSEQESQSLIQKYEKERDEEFATKS
ncbi:oligoribonuclease, mitochondrial [[Candida] jaroonii]|uniref:Oligoribonuclease, mitochondrial n=1 Tax=[Candida] jaroonii TaxID=467808 RepID=A0ACA9Y9G4_9ASCO|nr:oligoribonuclease, mitochondrial [[Candida] jaroonii]